MKSSGVVEMRYLQRVGLAFMCVLTQPEVGLLAHWRRQEDLGAKVGTPPGATLHNFAVFL